MDGLSGASSVIAVVSFALQLAESVKKLYDFWQSVDEAPDTIRHIVRDLKQLSGVFTEIAHHGQKYGQDGSITDILESCTEELQDMITTTSSLEHGMKSSSGKRRKWSAVKAVFKDDKITRFQTRLVNMKTTLILARQTLLDKSLHRYFDHTGQALATMTHGMTILQEQSKQSSGILGSISSQETGSADDNIEDLVLRMTAQITNPFIRSGFKAAIETAVKEAQSGPICTIDTEEQFRNSNRTPSFLPTFQRRHLHESRHRRTNCIFGQLIIRSTAIHIMTDAKEAHIYEVEDMSNRISVIFRPATWLMRLGLAYELRCAFLSSENSWKQSFHIFQPVPDDSLIFQFCRTGNLEGLKLLLSSKKASVWDVNSHGWTPLHFAAHYLNVEVSQLLLAENADCNAVTYPGHTYLDVFISGAEYHVQRYKKDSWEITEHLLYFIQTFLHQTDDIAEDIPGNCNCGEQHSVDDFEMDEIFWVGLLKGLVNMSKSYLHTSHLLNGAIGRMATNTNIPITAVIWAAGASKSWINFRKIEAEYLPITKALRTGQWDKAEIFASIGAELHIVGVDTNYSPVTETATSIALYNSNGFYKWRQILRKSGIDIERFIEAELCQGRLQKDGWNAQTLRLIFDLDFYPQEHHKDCIDCSCGCIICVDQKGADETKDNENNKGGESETLEICGAEDEIMVEVDWQKLLDRIKHNESLDGYIDRYLDNYDSGSQYSSVGDREIEEVESDDTAELSEESEGSRISEDEDGNDLDENSTPEEASSDGNSGVKLENEPPEWFCITCWYSVCVDDISSTASEAASNDDEDPSPLLLNIDI